MSNALFRTLAASGCLLLLALSPRPARLVVCSSERRPPNSVTLAQTTGVDGYRGWITVIVWTRILYPGFVQAASVTLSSGSQELDGVALRTARRSVYRFANKPCTRGSVPSHLRVAFMLSSISPQQSERPVSS